MSGPSNSSVSRSVRRRRRGNALAWLIAASARAGLFAGTGASFSVVFKAVDMDLAAMAPRSAVPASRSWRGVAVAVGRVLLGLGGGFEAGEGGLDTDQRIDQRFLLGRRQAGERLGPRRST